MNITAEYAPGLLQADLSVLDPSGYDSSLYSYSVHDPDIAEEMEQIRDTAFERFLERNFKRPIQMMLRESGDPATTIIEDLERMGPDILVLGRKHHPFLERLVVGSVSTKVMKAASVPVLIIPIPD